MAATATPNSSAMPMPTANTLRMAERLIWRISVRSPALEARRSSRASVVWSSPLIGSGRRLVGSTPPSGNCIRSTSEPLLTVDSSRPALAGFSSEESSSLASAASALPAFGFHAPCPPSWPFAAGAELAGVAVRGAEMAVLAAGAVRVGSARFALADGAGAARVAAVAPPRGTGARYCAMGVMVERGTQSDIPGRQASVSGPISPDSQRAFTPVAGSGPTWLSSMATYQSCPGSALETSSPAAGRAASAWPGPPPNALSKAWPSSCSSDGSPPPYAGPAGAGDASGGAAGARFTETTLLHFLQRTLTPFGPTLSSEIMYCEPQLSQANFMGVSRR